MGARKIDKQVNYSYGPAQTKQQVGLVEATTFPFIIFFGLSHRANTQMSLIPKIGTSKTLEAHNFVCKPPIEVTSHAKLQPLSKKFQRYVARHLNARNLG
jgi:hypothetical protein